MPHPAPILIVDDNPDDALLLRHVLRKSSVNNPITTAHDGATAQMILQTALAEPCLMPCAVFSDVSMANVDGFSLVRWARSHPRLDPVWFILLTSALDHSIVRASDAAGADGCFEKLPSANILSRFVAAKRR